MVKGPTTQHHVRRDAGEQQRTSTATVPRKMLTGWKRAAEIQSSSSEEWWTAWYFHSAGAVKAAVNPVQQEVRRDQEDARPAAHSGIAPAARGRCRRTRSARRRRGYRRTARRPITSSPMRTKRAASGIRNQYSTSVTISRLRHHGLAWIAGRPMASAPQRRRRSRSRSARF